MSANIGDKQLESVVSPEKDLELKRGAGLPVVQNPAVATAGKTSNFVKAIFFAITEGGIAYGLYSFGVPFLAPLGIVLLSIPPLVCALKMLFDWVRAPTPLQAATKKAEDLKAKLVIAQAVVKGHPAKVTLLRKEYGEFSKEFKINSEQTPDGVSKARIVELESQLKAARPDGKAAITKKLDAAKKVDARMEAIQEELAKLDGELETAKADVIRLSKEITAAGTEVERLTCSEAELSESAEGGGSNGEGED